MIRHFSLVLLLLAPFGISRVARAAESSVLDARWEEFDSKGGDEFVAACRKLGRGCGVEQAAPDAFSGKKNVKAIRRKKTTPREVLNAITQKHSAYKWVERNGVVNLEPKRRTGEDILSRKLDEVHIHGVSSFKAALDVLHQAGIPFSYQLNGRTPSFGVINFDLKGVTVREALNAIAQADGQIAWVVSHDNNPTRANAVTILMPSWRKAGVPFSADEQRDVKN